MSAAALLLSLCVTECLISERNPFGGSLFALSGSLLAWLHPALILCIPLLLSLQFLYLSLREKLRLRFTEEACRRRGYRKAAELSYCLYLERSLRVSD